MDELTHILSLFLPQAVFSIRGGGSLCFWISISFVILYEVYLVEYKLFSQLSVLFRKICFINWCKFAVSMKDVSLRSSYPPSFNIRFFFLEGLVSQYWLLFAVVLKIKITIYIWKSEYAHLTKKILIKWVSVKTAKIFEILCLQTTSRTMSSRDKAQLFISETKSTLEMGVRDR